MVEGSRRKRRASSSNGPCSGSTPVQNVRTFNSKPARGYKQKHSAASWIRLSSFAGAKENLLSSRARTDKHIREAKSAFRA